MSIEVVLNNFLLKSGNSNLLQNFGIYFSFVKPKLADQILEYFKSFNPKSKSVNILSYDPFSPKRGYGIIKTGTPVLTEEQKQQLQKNEKNKKQKDSNNINQNNPFFLPLANQLLKSLIAQLSLPADIQYNCCDIYMYKLLSFIIVIVVKKVVLFHHLILIQFVPCLYILLLLYIILLSC